MATFVRRHFFRVTLSAALVLLVEAVLFHVLEYIGDFFVATSVISYAVLGLGLGAFAATRVHLKETYLFWGMTIGTTGALLVTSYVLVQYPAIWAIATSTAACVFFPTVYIAVLFRQYPGGRIYLFDMAGAALGVLATVIGYSIAKSEAILLFITCLLPLIGLTSVLFSQEVTKTKRILLAGTATLFLGVGATLFIYQVTTDGLNIFKVFNREFPSEIKNIFTIAKPHQHRASYDSLVGRIDIIKVMNSPIYQTCYNAHPNDQFYPNETKQYDFYEKRNIRWRTNDMRVLYGLKKDPKVFIIGSAAAGIINTVKKLTPPQNILPVEIQPALIRVMTKDFYIESGRAYKNLTPVVGNAISVLKSRNEKFDIITMINTHTGPNLSHLAGPDYLHTAEHYNLYFDHLSDDGYILFEERPTSRRGELALFRMLHTAWQTLKRRGVEDPSKHFMIWEWQNGRNAPRIDRTYDKKRGRYRSGSAWYVGMIISRKPLQGSLRESALDWYHEAAAVCRLAYLDDYLENGDFADIMQMIETGDFSSLSDESFDPAIITLDRPFTSFSTTNIERLDNLLYSSAIIFIVLTVLFTIALLRKAPVGKASFLGVYNILIGFAYFLIEIMLIQAYQNVFISAAWSLILVLGLLLLSSGVGGYYCYKLKSWFVTVLLVPISLGAIYIPELVLSSGMPSWIGKTLGVVLIGCTGFLMGFYFPRGLVLADQWNMKAKVPGLFALNSVAGSFAVILALYCGITVGYQNTLLAAIILYFVAGLLSNRAPIKIGQ